LGDFIAVATGERERERDPGPIRDQVVLAACPAPVNSYTNDAGLMIEHAIGEFSFQDEGATTRLTWSYSFQPRSAITRPLLANFVRGPWADLMRATLQAMREGGQHHAPANPDRHQHQARSQGDRRANGAAAVTRRPPLVPQQGQPDHARSHPPGWMAAAVWTNARISA
jgi:hypothetical protein